MEKHTRSNRGRSGHEGKSVKAFGALAFAGGLVWLLIAWTVSEGASGLVLPAVLAVAGVIAFLVGRAMARPLANASN